MMFPLQLAGQRLLTSFVFISIRTKKSFLGIGAISKFSYKMFLMRLSYGQATNIFVNVIPIISKILIFFRNEQTVPAWFLFVFRRHYPALTIFFVKISIFFTCAAQVL